MMLKCDSCVQFDELQKVHHILYDLARDINAAYGLQNFAEVTTSLFNVILNIYLAAVNFLHIGAPWFGQSKTEGVRQVLPYVLMSVWRLVIIVYSCDVAIQEANRTEQLVNKLLLLAPLGTCGHWKGLQSFARQIARSRLHYDALGLFSLDRVLLANCVATLTTYLVILVQFGLSGDNKTNEVLNITVTDKVPFRIKSK
ncbi:putative gustatory receptor 28b [Schistocerca serialis cubense]|uniref:putative gustatory receptor 28b n=1 Tax=Schistocerca serialis cubense TaxID=2023355 RepID=UPI00214E48FA|nr:putative gustatory receptor 28b [Schistocerca serialis cubense]